MLMLSIGVCVKSCRGPLGTRMRRYLADFPPSLFLTQGHYILKLRVVVPERVLFMGQIELFDI